MKHAFLLTTLLLAPLAALRTADAQKPSNSLQGFKSKLQTTMNRHLNQLLSAEPSALILSGF